jgi:type IV fimbrial biogenesis protein FimT
MNRTRRPTRSRRSYRGFTIVELMVAVTIVGIILAFAIPSFSGVILSNKLAANANSFIASTQLARSEAIKRNAVVRICRSADGATCAGNGTFQQGWVVFHDANNDGTLNSGETVIQVQQAISPDFHFTSDAYNIAFQGTGLGATAASLVLCRATPVGNQERVIRVEGVGRASVTKTTNGVCP